MVYQQQYLKLTFTWKIEDFDICPHVPGQFLSSPTFSVDRLKTTTFGLQLYPRGDNEENEDYVSLFIARYHDDAENEINLKCKISMVGSEDTLTFYGPFYKNSKKGYRRLCERNTLFNSYRRRVLPKNQLTVQCEIEILDKDQGEYENMHGSEDFENLSRDFGELFKSGIHSDMTIVVSDQQFKVHRAILDSGCPKLLEELEKIEYSNNYSLSTVEAPVLESVLSYLYTGVYRETGFREGVYFAAKRYALSDLKSSLESSLMPFPSSIKATTKINRFQFSFTWVIEELNSLQLNEEGAFLFFSAEVPEWSRMKIALLKIRNEGGGSYILRFLRLHKIATTFLHCEIKVPDCGGGLRILKECEYSFENEEIWETPIDFEAISIDTILQNAQLELHFNIRVLTDLKNVDTTVMYYSTIQKMVAPVNSITFPLNFHHLYESMKHSDVVLSVGGENLPAHKAILCSRSDVFAKMFLHETLENQTNVVEIQDIDLPTANYMLTYMYYGAIDSPVTVPEVIQIYAASDKYQVLPLKENCCLYLQSKVNAENIGDILTFADAHHDESLKKFAFDFISSNPEEILKAETGLKGLGSEELYDEVVNLLLRDSIEKKQ